MSRADWTPTLLRLTEQVRAHQPRLDEDLKDVEDLAGQLDHALPRAAAVNDPGDGIRSPNLTGGGRSPGAHSDPTSTTALAHLTDRAADGLTHAHVHTRRAVVELRLATHDPDQAKAHVHAAADELRAALGTLHRLLPATNTLRRLQPTGDPGCLAHRKAGLYVPSGPVKGACRWHYDFTRKYHRPCPPELTRHHDAGYALTDRIIARAFARKPLADPPKAKAPRPPSRRQRMLARVASAATWRAAQ